MYYEVITMTDMINEICRLDSKYKRSVLYRMLKEEVYDIYKKVKRKSKKDDIKENA